MKAKKNAWINEHNVAKKGVKQLRQVFFIFLAIYIINLIVPQDGLVSYTQRMWFLASTSIGLISLIILMKEKLPEKKTVIIGLVLGVLAGLIRPFTGVITFLAFLASMRIFEKTNNQITVLKRPIALTIFLGVVAGGVLGFINLLLAGGQTPEFAPSFYALVVSLNPGISEEITFRLFLYAFSIYLLGDQIQNRKETIWLYVLMIVPHVLLHFPDMYFVDGTLTLDLGSLLIGPGILALLFGLPMTLLMVKRDLSAAMITHTLVDFIRFIFLGLPF